MRKDIDVLLHSARRGDKAAQLALVRAFRPLVLKLAGQERNQQEREDVESELTLHLLTVLKNYRGRLAAFTAYLKTSLTNRFFRLRRREKYRMEAEEAYLTRSCPEDYIEIPAWEVREIPNRAALARLSPSEKELLTARLASPPPSWQSLAVKFHIPKSTLQDRYKKVLHRLQKEA